MRQPWRSCGYRERLLAVFGDDQNGNRHQLGIVEQICAPSWGNPDTREARQSSGGGKGFGQR